MRTAWCTTRVVQIPGQRKLLRKLQAKAKRHGSMPDPSNRIAKADIEKVLERLAVDSSLLVYANFNILVSCPADKVTPVTSYLETQAVRMRHHALSHGLQPAGAVHRQLPRQRLRFQSRLRPVSHPVGRRPVLLLQGAPEGIGGHAPDHILHRPAGTTRLHRHHRQGGQGEDDRQRQFLCSGIGLREAASRFI